MPITRKTLVAAAILLSALVLAPSITSAVAEATPLWRDLPTSVLDAYGLKRDDIGRMSNGYLDGTWRPSEYVTRGQLPTNGVKSGSHPKSPLRVGGGAAGGADILGEPSASHSSSCSYSSSYSSSRTDS